MSPRVTPLNLAVKPDPAVAKGLLDRLFRGNYLTDPRQCRPSGGDLAYDRRTGNFVPEIAQSAAGAFTAPGTQQTFYNVTNSECGPTTAGEPGGTSTLAVTNGDDVVVSGVVDGAGQTTMSVDDVDGDGVDEILLYDQALGAQTARLVHFEQGQLVTMKDFGQVYETTCGSGRDDEHFVYAIIRVTTKPGRVVDFSMERVVSRCP
jgi:hypothetical protein